jgi:hypothetical protein
MSILPYDYAALGRCSSPIRASRFAINCRCHSTIASWSRPGFSARWVTGVKVFIVASSGFRPDPSPITKPLIGV